MNTDRNNPQNRNSRGRFEVNISDEDYDSYDYSSEYRRRGRETVRGNNTPAVRRNGNVPTVRGGGGGASPSVNRGRGGRPPQAPQRRPQPPMSPNTKMTRTRTVVTKRGERFEIPDETALPPKIVRQTNKNARSKGCAVALAYAAIVCSISALLSFYMIVGLNDMFGLVKDKAEIVVEVPKGADLDMITDILDRNGIVEYPFFFKMYAQFKNDTSFKAGTFTLNVKSDYDMIIRKLTRPATADKSLVRVTFPEGLTIEQIGDLLEENCVCEKEPFLNSIQNGSFSQAFVKDIPKSDKRVYRLEGYLFPDTYEFFMWEGSMNAINKMLNNYEAKVINNEKLNVTGRTKSLKRSLDEIMILASIIERETPDKEEMKNVASVFYNRMKNPNHEGTGGKLESDATRWYPYATSTALRASTTLSENEIIDWVDNHKGTYDTYVVKGLPSGPICCPGENAITAALNPSKTNHYFFYTAKDGKHYYANTYAQHQDNIARAGG
ncbi:MAG: endolytic transglycosylase MltG [Oscillospiraceae bacterium]|jgi:UPF0755 protein|nr:endolytic transglycosylase MltG [Oscillospiraceae bacterium]